MGYINSKEDGDELGLDLDLRSCVICRRELLPWQDACPDDGGAGVKKEELSAGFDPQLARFQALEAQRATTDAPSAPAPDTPAPDTPATDTPATDTPPPSELE